MPDHVGHVPSSSERVVVPAKRPLLRDGADYQTKQAKEAVARATAGIGGQTVLLDLLGDARVVVDGIKAVLEAVGEVCRSHHVGVSLAYNAISSIPP